jgi:hypothetical protein
MNQTLMSLSSVHGLLQATTPSLDQFDDWILADIGLNRDGTPISEHNLRRLPMQRRGLGHLLDWLSTAMARPQHNV